MSTDDPTTTGTGRDRDLEAAFLDRVEHSAPGGTGFRRLVQAVLADGDRKFRGAFQQRGAATLCMEAGEEAVDLVAWSLLALTVAERSGLDRRDLDRVHADLQAAAAASANAFRHVSRAIGVLAAAEGDRS